MFPGLVYVWQSGRTSRRHVQYWNPSWNEIELGRQFLDLPNGNILNCTHARISGKNLWLRIASHPITPRLKLHDSRLSPRHIRKREDSNLAFEDYATPGKPKSGLHRRLSLLRIHYAKALSGQILLWYFTVLCQLSRPAESGDWHGRRPIEQPLCLASAAANDSSYIQRF